LPQGSISGLRAGDHPKLVKAARHNLDFFFDWPFAINRSVQRKAGGHCRTIYGRTINVRHHSMRQGSLMSYIKNIMLEEHQRLRALYQNTLVRSTRCPRAHRSKNEIQMNTFTLQAALMEN
jgi:hypothetical protein